MSDIYIHDLTTLDGFCNQLTMLLADLALVSIRSEFSVKGRGCACRYLIERSLPKGIKTMVADWATEARSSSTEIRLNGSGLKLWINWPHHGLQGWVSIGGDQAADYDDFVRVARKHIEQFGLKDPY